MEALQYHPSQFMINGPKLKSSFFQKGFVDYYLSVHKASVRTSNLTKEYNVSKGLLPLDHWRYAVFLGEMCRKILDIPASIRHEFQ
jgi:hypothetical protein